eukprot:SAG22_NODE_7_length_40155_cov_25.241356_1_plen_73_part_00
MLLPKVRYNFTAVVESWIIYDHLNHKTNFRLPNVDHKSNPRYACRYDLNDLNDLKKVSEVVDSTRVDSHMFL